MISRRYERNKKDIQSIQEVADLVKHLPEANKACLDILIKHLHTVSLYADSNKMNASNLGVVFGPTLFRQKSKGKSDKAYLSSSSILEEIKDMPDQARLIELLIMNQEYFEALSQSQHVSLTQV